MKLPNKPSKPALLLFLFLAAIPAFAQPKTISAVSKGVLELQHYRSGDKVHLHLEGGGHMTGTIVALDDSTVTLSQLQGPDRIVALSAVQSVRDRSSLGSRLQMGPCVGPVTLAIASPFIVAKYLAGH